MRSISRRQMLLRSAPGLLLGGLATRAAAQTPIPSRRPAPFVSVTPRANGELVSVRDAPGLARFVAALELRSDHPDFGGLSGLLVEPVRVAQECV